MVFYLQESAAARPMKKGQQISILLQNNGDKQGYTPSIRLPESLEITCSSTLCSTLKRLMHKERTRTHSPGLVYHAFGLLCSSFCFVYSSIIFLYLNASNISFDGVRFLCVQQRATLSHLVHDVSNYMKISRKK